MTGGTGAPGAGKTADDLAKLGKSTRGATKEVYLPPAKNCSNLCLRRHTFNLLQVR